MSDKNLEIRDLSVITEEAVPVAENIEQIEADEKEYEFVADAIFDNKSFN